MKSRIVGAIACSVLGILSACKSANTPPPSRGGDGVNSVQFQDIVVPDGLHIHDTAHESHSIEEVDFRFGHFVYSGQTRLDDACQYVLLRMPEHAWSLVADELQPDKLTRKITFTRGRYRADYSFRRQDGITSMVVDYHTEVR
jgi:hypothetical protein